MHTSIIRMFKILEVIAFCFPVAIWGSPSWETCGLDDAQQLAVSDITLRPDRIVRGQEVELKVIGFVKDTIIRSGTLEASVLYGPTKVGSGILRSLHCSYSSTSIIYWKGQGLVTNTQTVPRY